MHDGHYDLIIPSRFTKVPRSGEKVCRHEIVYDEIAVSHRDRL